ncbi:ribosomal protein L29 [Neorickettsia helminthoeca str. Oregon]|uniref:Large ribosomal subunit protein uL29 n=1 Tax=Neorickettsia helminthoeca str. Oregon TaxID=1286528 RepID=X5H3E4_9RICK|nr:50S ribosomal protein L29 [Neorickettsia helminthoeca]AHX11218.1 ribosomal protein L29 [Neorickettsia helminthoeca str. Oregon]
MKIADLRNMSVAELRGLLSSMRSELFNLSLKPRGLSGNARSSRRYIRRGVARILTCLKENKRG